MPKIDDVDADDAKRAACDEEFFENIKYNKLKTVGFFDRSLHNNMILLICCHIRTQANFNKAIFPHLQNKASRFIVTFEVRAPEHLSLINYSQLKYYYWMSGGRWPAPDPHFALYLCAVRRVKCNLTIPQFAQRAHCTISFYFHFSRAVTTYHAIRKLITLALLKMHCSASQIEWETSEIN